MVRRIKDVFFARPQLERVRLATAKNPCRLIEPPVYGLDVPTDETGEPIDFRLRWTQRRCYEIYREEVAKDTPTRVGFLKSRRAGLTSIFAADDYLDAWSKPNRRIGIVAQNEFRAQEILGMCKTFHKSMHDSLKMPLRRDALGALVFADNDSSIMIGTCKEPDKVRGGGLHHLHLSEWAHFGRMFTKTMQETAMTLAADPSTAIIMESTGSNRGSSAHTWWQASKAGGTIYRVTFMPWTDDPTAVKPFYSSVQQESIMAEMQEVEPRLYEMLRFYKCTPEQMHWAYWVYLYKAHQDYEYFCREYPLDEEMAWDSAGISFFGDNEIAAMYRRMTERGDTPLMFTFAGHFINTIFGSSGSLHQVKKHDDDNGNLVIKVWAAPQSGHTYVLGSDVSLGEQGGAYSSGYVIDLQTREMMCSFRGRIRPDEHAYVIASLGWIYNEAILAPEVNPGGGGLQVINDLQRLGYYRIYIWRVRDDKRGIILTQKLGFVTNRITRPLMLQELRKMFIDCAHERFADPGLFRDTTLLSEMRTFQKDPETGNIEAAESAYDDTIFGLAIAHLVASDEVIGGHMDIYGTYGKPVDNHPFSDLLRHMDDIEAGQSPEDVVESLTTSRSEFRDGQIHFYDS